MTWSLVGLVVLAGLVLWRDRNQRDCPQIDAARLAAERDQDRWVVVDVRSRRHYQEGHVPEAVSWPLEEMTRDLTRAEAWRGRPVALVCYTGQSAKSGVRRLRDAGFSEVWILKGGVQGWRRALGVADWVCGPGEASA